MQGKITKATVEKLPLNSLMWDSALVGFGARRQLRHVHYLLRYRLNGRQKFISIGKHGSPWTPEGARNEARRLLGLVTQRVDPASEREPQLKAENFGAEVERYLERKRGSLKPRTMVEIERHLRVYAKALHPLPLNEINRRAVALCLAEVEASGAATRNRVRASLSAFFTFAIREGLLEVNPVSGTGKAEEGPSRERVLSEAELASILSALGEDQFSDMIRLLVLTGQRRMEIGGLRWSEVDFDRGLICFPPERSKNNRQHELPISRQVRAILERQPRRGEFVFDQRLSWSHAKAQLAGRLNGMANWRLHDLRRSCATHMADRLDVQPHVIEAVLNHVSGFRAGVAGMYQRAKYQDAMRDALQRYGDWIDRLAVM